MRVGRLTELCYLDPPPPVCDQPLDQHVRRRPDWPRRSSTPSSFRSTTRAANAGMPGTPHMCRTEVMPASTYAATSLSPHVDVHVDQPGRAAGRCFRAHGFD